MSHGYQPVATSYVVNGIEMTAAAHDDDLGSGFQEESRQASMNILVVAIVSAVIGAILSGVAAGALDSTTQGAAFWTCVGFAIVAWLTWYMCTFVGIFWHYRKTAEVEALKSWEAAPRTPMLSWRKANYSQAEWAQYFIEEFGPEGRSVFRNSSLLLITGISWSLMFILASSVAGACSATAGLAIGIAFAAASGIILLVGGLVGGIKYATKKRFEAGPKDFRASPEGLFWDGTVYSWQPGFTCCLQHYTLHDLRINTYDSTQVPCLEFCLSYVHKNESRYLFHRVPIPREFMNQTRDYVQSVADTLPRTSGDCWLEQSGYAYQQELRRSGRGESTSLLGSWFA